MNELVIPIIDDSPDTSETVRLDLPASLKYLNILGACLTAILAHAHYIQQKEIISYNIQLALHEICTNITIHAYAHLPEPGTGRIEIAITLHPEERSLEFELSDEGQPFDERKIIEPDLVHGQVHGYGLYLALNKEFIGKFVSQIKVSTSLRQRLAILQDLVLLVQQTGNQPCSRTK